MAKTTLVLVRDLLFASRITGAAQAAGAQITLIRDPEKLAAEPGNALIVDLNQPGALEAAARWRQTTGKPVVGFVSHVDRETIDRAEQLGLDQVLPRGQFVQRIAEFL